MGSAGNTVFSVRRQVTLSGEPAGAWADLPFAGRKPFVDAPVPAGATQVLYQVQANRGGKLSDWSEPGQLLFGAAATAAAGLRIAA